MRWLTTPGLPEIPRILICSCAQPTWLRHLLSGKKLVTPLIILSLIGWPRLSPGECLVLFGFIFPSKRHLIPLELVRAADADRDSINAFPKG